MKTILLLTFLAIITGFQTTENVMICDSTTAKAYHLIKEKSEDYCLGLKRCSHTIKTILKADAIALGRTPCSMCYSGTKTSPTNTSPSIKSATPAKAGYTQCTGVTAKGARCKRMVSSISGRCYQH